MSTILTQKLQIRLPDNINFLKKTATLGVDNALEANKEKEGITDL